MKGAMHFMTNGNGTVARDDNERAWQIVVEAVEQMNAENIGVSAAMGALTQMMTDFVTSNAPEGKRLMVTSVRIFTEECPDETVDWGCVN
jgi:hypothetical protein